jgi:uncharacterized membrane protein YeaQ/YmgE (transglycosylase-associated protein family)
MAAGRAWLSAAAFWEPQRVWRFHLISVAGHGRRGQQRRAQMSLLSWLVVGLVAGWIGSMIVNRRGEGLIMDILLGVVGAFVGGYLFHLFGHSGVSGINLYSIFVAAVGSAVVLFIYHAIFRRRVL